MTTWEPLRGARRVEVSRQRTCPRHEQGQSGVTLSAMVTAYAGCGREFEAPRRHARTCSARCRKRVQRATERALADATLEQRRRWREANLAAVANGSGPVGGRFTNPFPYDDASRVHEPERSGPFGTVSVVAPASRRPAGSPPATRLPRAVGTYPPVRRTAASLPRRCGSTSPPPVTVSSAGSLSCPSRRRMWDRTPGRPPP